MQAESQIVEIDATAWEGVPSRPEWTAALEAGKVLFFPHLRFDFLPEERAFLRPDIRDPKSRNISLNVDGTLKGAAGDAGTQA
ncbi:MAG: 3-deoxy-D-manno-oct-2-ulosonic acid (Kdo) hydroxylase, partial [Variovorax paradoxus]